MNLAPEWATHSGDAWARGWRQARRALSHLARQLDKVILESAPAGPFRAFDIGCGAEQRARARPEAAIVASDLSPALVQLAQERVAELSNIRVLSGDAEQIKAGFPAAAWIWSARAGEEAQ